MKIRLGNIECRFSQGRHDLTSPGTDNIKVNL